MSLDIDLARRVGTRDICARIKTDSRVAGLVGPSGAGKTTILNMIAGLVRPDSGHIQIDDVVLFDSAQKIDLPAYRRGCGYVFQDTRLFPHLRVRANLLYGRRDRQKRDVDGIAEMLGISHLLQRWPATLSGGEAQRVTIGRTLLSNPRLLLLDEPLSSLDGERRTDLLALILRIHQSTAIPILYVSHDLRELDALGADVISLVDHR